jgi:hypothetical protein
MDTNADGVVSSADTGWSNLKVWVDGNSDAATQTGELRTLDSLGIVQLNLAYTDNPSVNNGNVVGLISSFVTSNGQSHQMADVWFATSTNPVNIAAAQIATLSTDQIIALTTSQVPALSTVAITALTTSQIAVLTPSQVTAITSAEGLQSQVGGLVQAMGSFNGVQASVSGSNSVPLVNTQSAEGLVGAAVSVAGMVGALQQFDQNGSMTGLPEIANGVITTTPLANSPLLNPANNGILASGK